MNRNDSIAMMIAFLIALGFIGLLLYGYYKDAEISRLNARIEELEQNGTEIVEVYIPYEVEKPVVEEVLIPVEITVPVVETVPVPVERVVEVTVPVEVEKVVTMQVEKIVEVPVERIVEVTVPVEKIVEVTVPVETPVPVEVPITPNGDVEPYSHFLGCNVEGALIIYDGVEHTYSHREIIRADGEGIYDSYFDVTIVGLSSAIGHRGLQATLSVRNTQGRTQTPAPEGSMFVRYAIYDYTANMPICEGVIEMCVIAEGETLLTIAQLYDGELTDQHTYWLTFDGYMATEGDVDNG